MSKRGEIRIGISAVLDVWAKQLVMWPRAADGDCAHPKKAKAVSRDVYVYFDNDAKVREHDEALALKDKVELLLRKGTIRRR